MKRWVKVGGFSYYSRILGKSDNFLKKLNSNRKLNLEPKECFEYYKEAKEKEQELKKKLQEMCYWLEDNKLVFSFGKFIKHNKLYKSDHTIYAMMLSWSSGDTNLPYKSTIERWEKVAELFEEFKKEKR